MKTPDQSTTDLQAKVFAAKEERRAAGDIYNVAPKVSFILQFFNQKENIPAIIAALRALPSDELIVIDDGSVDDSYHEWLQCLTKPNDFLLHCNDLYEVRTYDRAMRMAKGEFVCLLQDDDIPPNNRRWLEQALALFDRFPKLLILSGRQGVEIASSHPNVPLGAGWAGGGRVFSRPRLIEANTGIPFMFTMAASRAPMFLRRELFLGLGGIDQAFAPFMCDDIEACLRAWSAGFLVGFYQAPFHRGRGGSGMSLFNQAQVAVQDSLNIDRIYAAYGKQLEEGVIQDRVQRANSELNQECRK